MKSILILVSCALALASAPMIHGQQLDPELQKQLDRLAAGENQKLSANDEEEATAEDWAPSQYPQAMNVAMTRTTTTGGSNHRNAERHFVSKTHEPLSVFEHPKYFKGVIEKYHLRRKTMKEAGLARQPLHDEFKGYAMQVILDDDALVWVDEGNRPWYRDGCFNRIDVVAPPVVYTPPPPAPPTVRYVPAPPPIPYRTCEHYQIVRVHDCYGNVTSIRMNDAEFGVWLQTQGSHYRIPGVNEGNSRRRHARGREQRGFDPRMVASIVQAFIPRHR